MKNLETNRKLMANRRNTCCTLQRTAKSCTAHVFGVNRTLLAGTCICSCRGHKQKPSSSFDIRGCGPSVTKHCRNPSHSDPGGTLEKIKQSKSSKEVKETALASESKSFQSETKPIENQSACHDLSVWNILRVNVCKNQTKSEKSRPRSKIDFAPFLCAVSLRCVMKWNEVSFWKHS